MGNDAAEQKAFQAADDVIKQVTGTEKKGSINRDKLLVIAENKDALAELMEQTKFLRPSNQKYLKQEVQRNISEGTPEEAIQLVKIDKELELNDDGKKNKQSKTAEEKESEGLPFNQRDAAGKIEFVLDKAMKMFEKFSDTLSSLGSKTLNSLAKIMVSMKMEPAWVDFVRGLAGGEKAQLQSALKANGLALAKGDSTKDAAAMETLKAGYKEKATKQHEVYKTAFASDPKNKPAVTPTPTVVPTTPGAPAPAVAAAPAVAPVAAPQPISLEQYMETTYTFEMYTGEWLPKALEGKTNMIATLKPNGKGQKLISLETLAAMRKETV